MVTKILAISAIMQNVFEIGLRVSVLRMRDFAPLVLEKGYSRDARTDFDTKYVK